MATLHLRSQALERAQLQLFDGALALAETLGNFPDTSLVHKALLYDATLRFRKLFHQLEKPCAVFDGAHVGLNTRIWRIVLHGMFA
jgi:hypothetical protein